MAGVAGFGLGHADLRQLRARIGNARQCRIVDPGGQAKQGTADDDAGVVGADVGEGARADPPRVRDVAHGIDTPVGHASQSAIGGDARSTGAHVTGGQIERIDTRLPADRDQQVTAADPATIGQDQGRTRLDRRHLRALQHGDATRHEAIAQPRDQFRVLLAGDGCRLDDGDAAAKAGEGIGQFETDRPAAHYQQVVGTLFQLENRRVGEVANLVEARESAAPRRCCRRR